MIKDIPRWRNEIDIAEKFRKESFGEFLDGEVARAGFNIGYFDRGYDSALKNTGEEEYTTTLNLFHAITKNVIPSLLYQNPKVLSFPRKAESQDTAPIVGETVNHFYKQVRAKDTNRQVVWDAYVLGYGVSKVGYATKFGKDIEDEKKKLSIVDKVKIAVGLKKPQEEETIHPDTNYTIVSESPYICYVSPFNFGIDPRATCLEDAMYVYERFKKTVKWMKGNKKYKNTSELKGTTPDLPESEVAEISSTEIEDFKTVDLYEIHYRDEDGYYILVISKDGTEWREHYHEKSIYELPGWQYRMLCFNKHRHRLYPISDMTKIKSLQDRYTSTIDSILEQVDRFVPKIAFSSGDVTQQGQNALRDGGIGALVECNKNPPSGTGGLGR